jgi:hypothetical protein
MSRCLDDHPQAMCLCEAEINRVLFHDDLVALHFRRMSRPGLAPHNTVELLNGRKQDDIGSAFSWYADSQQHFSRLYNKPELWALRIGARELPRSVLRYGALRARMHCCSFGLPRSTRSIGPTSAVVPVPLAWQHAAAGTSSRLRGRKATSNHSSIEPVCHIDEP